MRLTLRPSVQFRGYEASVDASLVQTYTLTVLRRQRYELSGGTESRRCGCCAYGERAALTLDEKGVGGVPYEMERSRGYQSVGSLWSPGYLPRRPAHRQRRHAGRLDRAVGDD